jgi:hypothetical protein
VGGSKERDTKPNPPITKEKKDFVTYSVQLRKHSKSPAFFP